MNIKNRAFIIDLVIYPLKLYVVFGELKKQTTKLLNSLPHPPSEEQLKDILVSFENDDYGARTLPLNNGVMIHFKNMDKDDLYDFIPHEALHAVKQVLSVVGVGKMSSANDEAYCYLLGYITKQIFLNYLK